MTRAGSLEVLASRLGVEVRYRDQIGETRQVPESTVEALVAQLQPTTDDATVPPVIVRQSDGDSTLSIPIDGVAGQRGRWCWEIETDSGHRLDGTIADGADCIVIRDLPLGYHRLRLLRSHDGPPIAEHQLIVAPPRAFVPPALQTGGRAWGLAVQLFAVRSAHNWGIGDFTDLADLIDRAAEAGVSAIGLNPLHALFPEEPERASPYSPSSRDFLNVLYIDPEAVADFAECAPARALRQSPEFEKTLVRLRAATFVDYVGVAAAKLPTFDLLYRHFCDRHLLPQDEFGRAFRKFQDDAGLALRRFATFHALREHFGSTTPGRMAWRRWPKPFQRADSVEVAAFAHDNATRIEFFEYLQWQAELQLRHCAKRARDAGMPIGLYVDIAVGVDADSAEAWALQDYLVDHWSVGAPPDEWNLKGQNWGIPPPHPGRMRETAYASFRQTLRANMRFAGAIRLDHILGFMRLFWIPAGASPADGAYVHYPLGDLLAITALESQRNRCLIIGEDLGTVPEGLREKLRDGGLLSYRLLYFERDEGGAFCAPQVWPDRALVAVTTHDLPTVPGYWDGTDIELKARLDLYPSPDREHRDRELRQTDRQQLVAALHREGLEADADGPAPVESIYRYLARTPGELLMVQPEDLLGVHEQMNLPGTRHEYPNWRRKLPLDLPPLFSEPAVRRTLAAINAEGRAAPGRSLARLRRSAENLKLPQATYRLQFNRDFTFEQATHLLPYLRDLGISHVYASSYLKARPGSAHGYDIADHNSLNPEIGTAAEFERFCETLRTCGMGQILDFIPNHMGIGRADNGWWLDILEWGRASPFADFFDIDWTPRQPALQGKVLLPLLGDQYGQVLERGELKLRFDDQTGSFSVWYFEHRFPIHPYHYGSILENALGCQGPTLDADSAMSLARIAQAFARTAKRDGEEVLSDVRARADEMKKTLAGLAARIPAVAGFLRGAAETLNGRSGEPDSFTALHRLLEQQHYRLAFWRVAADEVNYRRFFDINELAGIRMEQPAVFEQTHRLIRRLIAHGKLQGLRIDHVDGLFNPAGYFVQLQRLASDSASRAAEVEESKPNQPFYIVIEKILARHEHLRDEWPIAGTTGYEYISLVNGLFVDPAGERGLDRTYRRFLDRSADFDEILHACKTHVIDNILASELNSLASALDALSERHWGTRDYTLERLRAALKEVVAGFPVYRTYISERGIATEDRRDIDWAVSQARKTYTGVDPEILDFVHAAVTADLAEREPAYGRGDVLRFAMRFQQYTGPVMAKSVEDTCFYRYNRLLSLNEVGGDPRQFGISTSAFHHLMQERAKRWPHALSPSATHDTKRGADVRARLNVLSELPKEWDKRVRRWASLNRYKRQRIDRAPAPSPNDEYMTYQTMLGAWPVELTAVPTDAAAIDRFRTRLQATVLKSIREAKRRTSWTNPNAAYEAACITFVARILDTTQPNPFLEDFVGFQAKIARLGVLNGLCQSVIALTAPGVPDIYQGGELWDLNLVDPDNRRPVDFEQRRCLLAEVRQTLRKPATERSAALHALLEEWKDGRIKLAVIAALLECRGRERALFAHGGYQPLEFDGPQAGHLLGYARHNHGGTCIVIIGRLLAGLIDVGQAVYDGASLWRDTALILPDSCRQLEDVLTGRAIETQDGRLKISKILGDLPAAVLLGRSGD